MLLSALKWWCCVYYTCKMIVFH